MNIRIRPAIARDCAELTRLSLRSKQSNGYDEAFMQACQDELSVSDSDLQAGEWWVAEACDERQYAGCADIVGCVCLVSGENSCGEVSAFFVDPEWQRRGIGRQLWKKVLQRTHAHKVKNIVLDADPHAVPFYQALGFTVIGEKPSGSIAGRMLPHMAIEV
jgi:GNAT superfamily N-acetyltransferase